MTAAMTDGQFAAAFIVQPAALAEQSTSPGSTQTDE